ncbi:hypothetical protein PIROE2DRAFT_8075 [Piromyces sp. E2]|nr:hypothetical protein PIROE2DRAFT_8075 [Piromyces sp. E2]|eukprot:OUM65011.1 hypothetical protein PIROE2DRAFT_8075 [Piromyces sp. E2]
MYGRSQDKVGFNLKFDKKFLNRKSFKLRPDPGDSSRMRSKICCDILNRLGLPSIQGTYARLYMNNKFWGLYTLMDSLKTSWVKQTFNPSEKEVTTLIQCKNGGFHLKPNSSYACLNANDDYPDMSEFSKFISNVNNAKTVADIEKYMDVDNFLKHLAFEWLIGSFDHFMIYGHNFNWYKRESDGKWIIIYYDFDNTFGNGISSSLWSSKTSNQDGSSFNRNKNFVDFTFADWEKDNPILKKLVFQNKTKFKQIVREVLVQGFNPDILNPRIDEIKSFLVPYVKEDCTKGSDGTYPGRINKKGTKKTPSYSSFENNIENSLKTWIKNKFNVAISNYSLNKNDILAESATFVPKPYNYGNGSTTTKTKKTTTTEAPKTTTTTTSSETTSSAEPIDSGTRYDIIKEGSSKISSEWINWSWGVKSYQFDSAGNMVNYITSGAWGGVSFKRSDNVLLGSGTLYFKAKTNDTNSVIQVLLHQANVDNYINAGKIEKVSTVCI